MASRSSLLLLLALCLAGALAVMAQGDGAMDLDLEDEDMNARNKRSLLPSFDSLRRKCSKDADCADIKLLSFGKPWCCNNKGKGNKFCYNYFNKACVDKRAAGRG